MQVTSGSSWPMSSSSDHRRTYSVAVDEDDMRAYGVEPDDIKPSGKHKRMSALADALVVRYMTEEGALSPDYGKARFTELWKVFKDA